MVRILWANGNSNISAVSRELFPAPLAPHTMMVDLFSTRKDNNPATSGSMVPFAISLVNVQGEVECFLMATESPFGLNG